MGYTEFKQGYIEAIFFTSQGDTDDLIPDDKDQFDFSEEAQERIELECSAFYKICSPLWEEEFQAGDYSDKKAGMDFWLTRNRHGAGFWDGDLQNGEELTQISHSYGETDAYTGDDELIYLS
jgi:hypothetical protein